MSVTAFAEAFADWSDLVSLALLIAAILTNGIDPHFSLWGKSSLTLLLNFITMIVLLTFTIFRYLLEGIHSTPAPREFLAISVIYIARWLYHFYNLTASAAFPGRLFRVALALRDLITLRFGRSSYHAHRGESEIVIRSGARCATGERYWRGKVRSQTPRGKGWVVDLVEEGMHGDKLSALGTVDYAAAQKTSLEDCYKRVYDTVMMIEGAGEPHIDLAPFLERYSAIAKTHLALRAGATGDSELAGVARRVAADACVFVSGKGDCRTGAQVGLINECVRKAAEELGRRLVEEGEE